MRSVHRELLRHGPGGVIEHEETGDPPAIASHRTASAPPEILGWLDETGSRQVHREDAFGQSTGERNGRSK